MTNRDYPLSATPNLSPVSSGPSFFGSKEKREERKERREYNRSERQTNRAVRQSNRGARCGKRGCPGQGSGLGFSGYN